MPAGAGAICLLRCHAQLAVPVRGRPGIFPVRVCSTTSPINCCTASQV